MRKDSEKAVLFGGCAAAALVAVGFAWAPAHAQTRTEGASGVEDIIVTAQRRTERLEDVPMAITALTPDTLEKAQVLNVQEIGQITPGVQINYGGAFLQPSIRGITNLTAGNGSENNVAIYVDGFFISDTTSINMDLVNVEDVQILKGPQGTLYGRNATAGAILINTLDPSDTFTGKVVGTYARFKDRSLSGYVSTPISDRIGFIVSGYYRKRSSHLRLSDPDDNQRKAGYAAPIEQHSFRSKLKVDATDELTVTLAYNYGLSSDASGLLFTPFDHIPSFLPGGDLRGQPPKTYSYNHENINESKTHELTAKVEWATGIGTLTSYTGQQWRKYELGFDVDGTYADIVYIGNFSKQRTFQQALDYYIVAIDDLDLIVGGLYFEDEYYPEDGLGTFTYGPGKVPRIRTERPLKTKAYALYADATWHVTDRLSLGVGGRYSIDKKRVSQQTFNVEAGEISVPFYSQSATFKRFTPRATARYELAPRTYLYGSYSAGFRSGAYGPSGASSQAVDLPIRPEDIDAFELGFKTSRQYFRFETAVFYYDYRNLHVALSVPNPLCPPGEECGIITLTGNAPKAEVYGIDFQLVASPFDRFNVTVGGALLHAEYGRFPNAVGTGLDAATDLNLPGQVQDWTGQQMSRAPDFTANLTADYTVDLASGSLRLSGNVAYSDSYVVSNPSLFGPEAGALANKQRYRQNAHAVVNAEVSWHDASNQFSIALFGKNLTDAKRWIDYRGLTFGDSGPLQAPVSYGIRLGYKF